MKRSIVPICLALLLITAVAVPAMARVQPPNPLPNGKPYEIIWNFLMDLQDQISNLQLIPGPAGPPGPAGAPGKDGSQGDKGDPGLACWDLNGNEVCDLATEDILQDGMCDARDCQGPQGDPGPRGPAGTCTDCACPTGEYMTGFDTSGHLICRGICYPGLTFCNGACADVQTDPGHCGTCENTCNAEFVSTYGCENGMCTIETCNDGYRDCNGEFSDGCEVDILTDSQNCGSCGYSCLEGQSCTHGVACCWPTGICSELDGGKKNGEG